MALAPAAAKMPVKRPRPSNTTGRKVVVALWAIILFDLHYFLGGMVASPLGRLLTLVILLLLAVIAFDLPRIIAKEQRWVWYLPFALLLVSTLISLPRADNQIIARSNVQFLVIYYLLALSTALYIKTPRDAAPLLAMFGFRFAWWAFWAGGLGLVPWHPTLANYDGFGGLCVMGVGVCYWFGLAATKKWQRNVLWLLAAYCILGVVASMARGAFLALVAVAAFIWLRSPRKGMTTLAMLGAVGVVLIASTVLFDGSFFYDEIMSVFDEGTETGTGAHRWAMWGAAVQVWKENMFFGVGPGNFGVYAASYFDFGEIEGFENPANFWGLNLHNAYVQILSELGLVGMLTFGAIMVDFVIKNRALHDPEATPNWHAGGGVMRLRYLAYGLEAAMVAVFLGNMVYASLFEPWFATLWAMNRMLWATTRSKSPKHRTVAVAAVDVHRGRRAAGRLQQGRRPEEGELTRPLPESLESQGADPRGM